MKSYFSKHAAIFLLLAITVITTGCNKILDLVSPDVVSDEDIFTSVDGLRNARTGMYHTLQDRDYYGGFFPLVPESYTDNATTGGYQVPELIEFADRQVTPDNLYLSDTYNAIYKSIYTANKIIENIDQVPDLEQEELDQTLGEALFVRALAHFDLLRTWGEHWDLASEYGISLALSTTQPELAIPRSSVEQSYQQVFEDLNSALTLLNTDNGNAYVSTAAVEALLARAYLYYGDKLAAGEHADAVINNVNYALTEPGEVTKIYSNKLTSESILELKFEQANPSFYNALTYLRDDALRVDVFFIAHADLNTFFESRAGDTRSQLLDYENNDVSIEPDGRSQKYRGETTKDNSAYLLRLAEMYLIRAEARGLSNGLEDLNTLRVARGLSALTGAEVPDETSFLNAILDERRAELNFEGHRLSDLARTGKVEAVLGEGVLPLMPIPQREISATNGVVVQNEGY